METSDVHRCRSAKDHAIRVHEVDIAAAGNRAVDGRCTPTGHQIQIIFCIIGNRLSARHGVVLPLDHIVRRTRSDIGRIARTTDCNARRHIVLARRRSKGDLRNQKSARHACQQCIAHTLR